MRQDCMIYKKFLHNPNKPLYDINYAIIEEKQKGAFAYKTISLKGPKQRNNRKETVKAIQEELKKERDLKRQRMI